MMALEKPYEVLVAIPQAEPSTLREVVKVLEPFKVPIMTLPSWRVSRRGVVPADCGVASECHDPLCALRK